jgi:choline dehydrogenase-like flavoprotein
MTIPSFGGSSVAFLPLQNVTSDCKDIIKTASLTNVSALLPPDIDASIIAGYTAQIEQLLHLYASPHAAVEEVAWAGYASVCTVLIRPLSRGTIMIDSPDPRKPPLYDFGTFSHPSDLEIAVRALKKVREWIASPAMQALGPAEVLPGASIGDGDGDIAAAIRGFATSSWQHPTSSCSMLKRELGGVVDSQLRVYGVRGLRIVDASVFPMAVGGHTSSTVYAVAEKVTDILSVLLPLILRICAD